MDSQNAGDRFSDRTNFWEFGRGTASHLSYTKLQCQINVDKLVDTIFFRSYGEFAEAVMGDKLTVESSSFNSLSWARSSPLLFVLSSCAFTFPKMMTVFWGQRKLKIDFTITKMDRCSSSNWINLTRDSPILTDFDWRLVLKWINRRHFSGHDAIECF